MKLFNLLFYLSILLFFSSAAALTNDEIKNGILKGTLKNIDASQANVNLGEVTCFTWQGDAKINPATPLVLAAISTIFHSEQPSGYTQNKQALIKGLLNNNANLLHQYARERIGYAGSAKTETCLPSLANQLNSYHQEITDWFIRNKKVTTLVDQENNTLLHLLAQSDAYLDDIKNLIAQGAQVDIVNAKGQTPLHIATQGDQKGHIYQPQAPEIARYFINSTNIDLTKMYTCPLARNPDYNETSTLLNRLWIAGNLFHTDTANWLIKNNKINASFDQRKNTLFHYLADDDKNYDGVEWLIANKANVEATNTDGQTPLHVALGKDFTAPKALNIALLIITETNIDLTKIHTFKFRRDNSEQTATESLFQTSFMYQPTARRAIDKILGLNKQGADLGDGDTLIHCLARFRFVPLADYLSDNKIKAKLIPFVNAQNNKGQTPLAIACICDRLDNVQTLLNLTPKPNIDIVDKNENTILHQAVQCISLPIITYLLKNSGASSLINKTNTYGKTPIQIIINTITGSGHNAEQLATYSKALTLLLEHGAKKEGLVDKIKGVNTYSAYKKNFDVIIDLIDSTHPKPATSAGSTGPSSGGIATNPVAKKLSKLQKKLGVLHQKLNDLTKNLNKLKRKFAA